MVEVRVQTVRERRRALWGQVQRGIWQVPESEWEEVHDRIAGAVGHEGLEAVRRWMLGMGW